MKKLFTLVIAGGMMAFYACGPSAEEIAAKEKAKQDSIHRADSIAAAEAAAKEQARQDSIAAAEAEMKAKAAADSARVADSLAAAKKGGSKPKPKPKPDQPKVGSKRGG